MIIWVDAQLSPALAPWISQQFNIESLSVRKLGMVKAKDPAIFHAAREAGAIVLTKDADFSLAGATGAAATGSVGSMRKHVEPSSTRCADGNVAKRAAVVECGRAAG